MMNYIVLSEVQEQPVTSDDFISKLIPNWVSFVTQLVALLILIAVVIIFAYKPVKKLIEQRQDYIEKNIKDSEQAKANALVDEQNAKEMIIASNKQAVEIIDEARNSALKEREKIVEETDALVKKMKDDAEKDILQSQLDAKEEIRQEMINVALLASEEVLKRNVSEEDNARFVEEFIKDVTK